MREKQPEAPEKQEDALYWHEDIDIHTELCGTHGEASVLLI